MVYGGFIRNWCKVRFAPETFYVQPVPACPFINECHWSNDKYASFFIIEYPDIEAAIAETANADQAGLFKYILSETILGIAPTEQNAS